MPDQKGQYSQKQWDLEGNALNKGFLKWFIPLLLCCWIVCLKQEGQSLNFWMNYCYSLKSVHQGEWQRLAWLFWIIVMLWPEKLANNLSLGN